MVSPCYPNEFEYYVRKMEKVNNSFNHLIEMYKDWWKIRFHLFVIEFDFKVKKKKKAINQKRFEGFIWYFKRS